MTPQEKSTKLNIVRELLERAAARYQVASASANMAPMAGPGPAAISDEAKQLEEEERAESAADVVKFGDKAVSKAIEVLAPFVAPPPA